MLQDVLSLGTHLKPKLTKALAELSDDERDLIRENIVAAEKQLLKHGVSAKERLESAQKELAWINWNSTVWNVILAQVDAMVKDSGQIEHSIHSISFLLSLVLEEISCAPSNEDAA